MLTLGEFKRLLRKVLDEINPVPDQTTVDDDRLAELEWALHEFAMHTALERTLRVENHGGRLTLPPDYLKMGGVLDVEGNYFLEPFPAVTPGNERPLRGWYEWPHGELRLLGVYGPVDIYYYAYYPPLRGDDNQVIDVPTWAVQPILMLAAAFVQMPYSVTASSLAQWKTRMDSGTPTDNPLIEQVNFFIAQYERALSKHQPQQQDVAFTRSRNGR